MCLNHPKTIFFHSYPHPLGPRKNYLPQNWSLVPKMLATTALGEREMEKLLQLLPSIVESHSQGIYSPLCLCLDHPKEALRMTITGA